jgi:hypothetical protein
VIHLLKYEGKWEQYLLMLRQSSKPDV